MFKLFSIPTYVCFALFLLLDIVILLSVTSSFLLTLCLVVQGISSLAGAILLFRYPLQTLFFVLTEYQNEAAIVKEMWIETVNVLAAWCLLYPGILTDVIGVCWFIPVIRKYCVHIAEEYFS